jgi:hypothetical protein
MGLGAPLLLPLLLPLLVWPLLLPDEEVVPLLLPPLLLLGEPLDPLTPLLPELVAPDPESSPLLPAPELLPGSVKTPFGVLLQASEPAVARVTIQTFVFMFLRSSGRSRNGGRLAQARVPAWGSGSRWRPGAPTPKHG